MPVVATVVDDSVMSDMTSVRGRVSTSTVVGISGHDDDVADGVAYSAEEESGTECWSALGGPGGVLEWGD